MSARINKPKIRRRGGRPTPAEKFILTVMEFSVTDFQEWQHMNDKVVTGKSINGWIITITSKRFNTLFEGKITNTATYINYALFGRKAGKRPPLAAIMEWVRKRGIRDRRMTIRELAYLIARKIGNEGTNPPFLQDRIRTKILLANTRSVLKRLSNPYAKLKGVEFAGDISRQLNKVASVTNKVKVTSSYDKNAGRTVNYTFNAGTSFFKVRPKIKSSFFEQDVEQSFF